MARRLNCSDVFQVLSKRGISSGSSFSRNYGPSPSDLKPSPPLFPEKPQRSRNRSWTDASRARLREAYYARKAQGKLHPLDKWRLENPACAFEVRSKNASKLRKLESEESLLNILSGFVCRKLNVWMPYSTRRYRLSLFGRTFVLNPPDIGSDWGEPPSVFISVSVSFNGPHPYPAQRKSKSHDPRLDCLGMRLFGRHPITGEPFNEWITSSDEVLQRIMKIADSIEAQKEFRIACAEGLKKNLAGERWGN